MKKQFSLLISIAFALSILNPGRAWAVAQAYSGPAQRSAKAVSFVPRQIRGANKRLRYTIKARYPQAAGAARDPRLTRLNQELRQFISKQVSGFTTDFQAPEPPMFAGGSNFESRYSVRHAADDLVSIAFLIETYYEGAVHGQHDTIGFNYDLNTGRLLSLADLFKPNSNYLGVISDYSVKALRELTMPDPEFDWVQSGAGPKEENYKVWNITRKGLEITFNPYQVASYAEGPKEVVIPYDVLEGVMDQDGPLGRVRRK